MQVHTYKFSLSLFRIIQNGEYPEAADQYRSDAPAGVGVSVPADILYKAYWKLLLPTQCK